MDPPPVAGPSFCCSKIPMPEPGSDYSSPFASVAGIQPRAQRLYECWTWWAAPPGPGAAAMEKTGRPGTGGPAGHHVGALLLPHRRW